MVKQTIKILFLLSFTLLAAGGTGLHHAPFMGFHGSHDSSFTEENDLALQNGCGCGQIHFKHTSRSDGQGSDGQGSDGLFVGGNGNQPGCDGHCLVCQFFSQIKFDVLAPACLHGVDVAICSNREIPGELPALFRPLYWQRGPPVA